MSKYSNESVVKRRIEEDLKEKQERRNKNLGKMGKMTEKKGKKMAWRQIYPKKWKKKQIMYK